MDALTNLTKKLSTIDKIMEEFEKYGHEINDSLQEGDIDIETKKLIVQIDVSNNTIKSLIEECEVILNSVEEKTIAKDDYKVASNLLDSMKNTLLIWENYVLVVSLICIQFEVINYDPEADEED